MLLLEGKVQHSYNLHILCALEETCSYALPQGTILHKAASRNFCWPHFT